MERQATLEELADGKRRRLNPFAFPSDTNLRFTLLAVSAIGSTLFVYNWLAGLVPGRANELVAIARRCVPATQRPILAPGLGAGLTNVSTLNRVNEALNACEAPYFHWLAAWCLGGVALVLALAIITYWALPPWNIWRRHLTPFDPDDAADVLAELRNLSRQAGLRDAPDFLLAASRRSTGGVAFGHIGKRYVALDGGLVTQFYTDPASFRAVLRHELAHLRNGDVDAAYLTIAIWLAFAVGGLLPFLIDLVRDPATALRVAPRVLAMAALVTLTGVAVLRARELYADVRASVWDAPDGGLRRVLDQPVGLERRGWRAALAFHPSRVARRLALDDTRPMFHMGVWDGVATGVAATVAYASINSLVWWLAMTMPQSLLVPTLSALVFAPLVAGIVGIGVWRGAFAHVAAGGQRPELVQLAAGLSLGLLAGQFLAFDAAVTYDSSLVALAVYKLAWVVVLGVSLYVFLRWVSGGANAWLAYAANRRSARPACLLGLGCASAVLVVWLGLLFGADGLAAGSSAVGGSLVTFALAAVGYATLYLAAFPVTLLVILTLWAYPLGPLLAQRAGSTTCPGWVYLDAPRPITLPVRTGDSVRHAAVAGLVGGLACATAYAIAWWWRSTLPVDVRQADSTTVAFYFGLVGVGIVVQTIVATGAAARAPLSPAAHGLFAAFVAGAMATLGFVVGAEVAGNRLAVDFIWQLITHVVGAGAVASLVAVLVVAACRGDVSRATVAWDGTPLHT